MTKNIERLFIANRGEIAIRIARAAVELGMTPVMAYSEDDRFSPHLGVSEAICGLPGTGARAYLDIDNVLEAALESGAEAIHPGYGFLSENADFAKRCELEDIIFVGPSYQTLSILGDKAAARKLATELGISCLPGTSEATSLKQARDFILKEAAGKPVLLKALHGGGGRGMSVVENLSGLDDAFRRCSTEAETYFGNGELYVERMVQRARHIEIQVLGDGLGNVIHLKDRECTLQRRHQKLVELAPSLTIGERLRESLYSSALMMAKSLSYSGVGTFEFLVDADSRDTFWFMEANPRLQVEHTVTEQITGIDLVQAQLQVAQGKSLKEMGLGQENVAANGFAIQLRVNSETIREDGAIQPSSGHIQVYEMPAGPGVRIDGYGRSGYRINPNFDTLLTKIVVSENGAQDSDNYSRLLARARRALLECRIEGVDTNLSVLAALVADADVIADNIYTRFLEVEWPRIHESAQRWEALSRTHPIAEEISSTNSNWIERAPEGTKPISPLIAGLISDICVREGDLIAPGQTVAVLEAMKMEHLVVAPAGGIVRKIVCRKGETIDPDQPIAYFEAATGGVISAKPAEVVDLEAIPGLLEDALRLRASRMDGARPQAVKKRHAKGQRTLRENIAAFCDAGSFTEYGGLALPAQRNRRSMEELREMGPADGLVAGTGSVNTDLFAVDNSRCVVAGYDYSVFAGTQGWANHKKLGRMFKLVAKNPMPVVIFAEGGGGRPGETDWQRASGLDCETFASFARLSGKAPLVGIVSGRCFAGNAALLGCCDVIIATRSATIGMGGPAMIEGGGLGVFTPDEVGPVSVQAPNGVIDIVVDNEEEAVSTARKYLAFFQGATEAWECEDQRVLRHIVPEERRRIYDVRRVVHALADRNSALELRRDFGTGLLTYLARIEGRSVGVIANDTRHLAGALDSDASDKGARFLRMCDIFGFPVVSLCDTPGFMVGPASEQTAAVRHMPRLFLAGANISVPLVSVTLRKGYGLGAMAMTGGGTREPVLSVAWPTAEYGGMGVEGAVRLGYRRELKAIKNSAERQAYFDDLVNKLYEAGKAHNAASFVEIDDVIDPADTRALIAQAFRAFPVRQNADQTRTMYLDSW